MQDVIQIVLADDAYHFFLEVDHRDMMNFVEFEQDVLLSTLGLRGKR